MQNTTISEFKTTHKLSDTSFKRLIKKVLTDNPGLTKEDLTERKGSQYFIIRPDLLTLALGIDPKVLPEIDYVDAEIIPENQERSGVLVTTVKAQLDLPFKRNKHAIQTVDYTDILETVYSDFGEGMGDIYASLKAKTAAAAKRSVIEGHLTGFMEGQNAIDGMDLEDLVKKMMGKVNA